METLTLPVEPIDSTLSGSEPAPADPQDVPRQARPWAARCIAELRSTREGDLKKIALGASGLLALGLVSATAASHIFRSDQAVAVGAWLAETLLWPVAAVLALVFSLPALVIVLRLLDCALPLRPLLTSASRAYALIGLACLGVVPVIALYALTGASSEAVFGFAMASYFAAGLLGTWTLSVDLRLSLPAGHRRAQVAVVAFLGYLAGMAVYAQVKLHLGVWS